MLRGCACLAPAASREQSDYEPHFSCAHVASTDIVFDHEFLADVVEVSLAHLLEAVADVFLYKLAFLLDC